MVREIIQENSVELKATDSRLKVRDSCQET